MAGAGRAGLERLTSAPSAFRILALVVHLASTPRCAGPPRCSAQCHISRRLQHIFRCAHEQCCSHGLPSRATSRPSRRAAGGKSVALALANQTCRGYFSLVDGTASRAKKRPASRTMSRFSPTSSPWAVKHAMCLRPVPRALSLLRAWPASARKAFNLARQSRDRKPLAETPTSKIPSLLRQMLPLLPGSAMACRFQLFSPAATAGSRGRAPPRFLFFSHLPAVFFFPAAPSKLLQDATGRKQ